MVWLICLILDMCNNNNDSFPIQYSTKVVTWYEICLGYDWDIVEEWLRYALSTPKIRNDWHVWDLRCSWDMFEICLRYVWYIHKICLIYLRYTWDMFEICLRYVWDIPEIWLGCALNLSEICMVSWQTLLELAGSRG